MNRSPIISRKQSLQILANDLRRAALEKRAADLKGATPEKRGTILAEIERDVRDEVRLRAKEFGHWDVIY
jgi:hypothetical protein